MSRLGPALIYATYSTGHPDLCALSSSPGNDILPKSDILTWCGQGYDKDTVRSEEARQGDQKGLL